MPDPEKPDDAATGTEKAMQILKEINEKVSKPADEPKIPPSSQPAAPDASAVREQYMKKMGWNDEQMKLHEESIASAQAPLVHEMAWSKIERNHKDLSDYKKGMEEELKN